MIDTSKLSNGKFLSGSYKDYKSTRGWFVGSFFEQDNPLKSDNVEIVYY